MSKIANKGMSRGKWSCVKTSLSDGNDSEPVYSPIHATAAPSAKAKIAWRKLTAKGQQLGDIFTLLYYMFANSFT